MYRRGRPEVEIFEPSEVLYRRYRCEHWISGQFTGIGFKFPKQSVNRARFGEPEDVLYSESCEFDGWGVLEFNASDIPERLEISAGPGFLFFMKHVPFEINYGHSEIWADKIMATGEYVEPSSSLKKLFRTIMSQRMKIRIEANL